MLGASIYQTGRCSARRAQLKCTLSGPVIKGWSCPIASPPAHHRLRIEEQAHSSRLEPEVHHLRVKVFEEELLFVRNGGPPCTLLELSAA